MDETDLLRIIESPISIGSQGSIRWSVDHVGWFPTDATALSNVTYTLKETITGVEIVGKVSNESINSLVASFTLGDLDPGYYTLYGKATADTGDVDTWYCDVTVPY